MRLNIRINGEEEMLFKGKIALVRIYNYVLSESEIYKSYRLERLLFMRWYERLWMWSKLTFKILMGC